MSNKYIGTKSALIGPETDHPEEGAAYLQPAPAANDGGEGKRLAFPEFNASVMVADDCPQEVIDALRTMCEVAYNSANPKPKDKKENQVEWYKTDFGAVLEENYQAQIAGFYNHDKTDEERKIRQAVISEYEDLIAIWKKYSKSQSPTYPAEFVEWANDNYEHRKTGWYSWDDVDIETSFPFMIKEGAKVYTTSELFTEWKRIKEQSK